MFRWVPRLKKKLESQVKPHESESELGASDSSEMKASDPTKRSRLGLQGPWGLGFVPYFLSAVLFLSGFFVVFAPFPLLALFFKKGRKWAWGAAITNGGWVFLAGGKVSLLLYGLFVAGVALILAELLCIKKMTLEKATLGTLLGLLGMVGIFLLGESWIHHVYPWVELQTQVHRWVEGLDASFSANPGWLGLLTSPDVEVEELKKSLMLEVPSVLAIFSLILVWSNLVLIIRANPSRLREKLGLEPSFFRKWKAPEGLVWPTIGTGFFLVFNMGWVSVVSLNFFKFMMAIYFLQGLSILTYYFDAWRVRGWFRMLGFSVAVFFMTLVVLALGFFDLWVDFRGRFKQV
ncbi:MAG: DUF2232 domain-containing protein [Bdellovibrionia bacterium]